MHYFIYKYIFIIYIILYLLFTFIGLFNRHLLINIYLLLILNILLFIYVKCSLMLYENLFKQRAKKLCNTFKKLSRKFASLNINISQEFKYVMTEFKPEIDFKRYRNIKKLTGYKVFRKDPNRRTIKGLLIEPKVLWSRIRVKEKLWYDRKAIEIKEYFEREEKNKQIVGANEGK